MNQVIPIKAFNDNYIWLYLNTDTRACFIVDPGDAKPVIKTLSHHGFDLKAILITHHHYDHCGGISELLKHYNVPVFAPNNEPIKGGTDWVAEGDIVSIPGIQSSFQVLDIPAHTNGHIAYYGNGALFCGDTLFSAGCGRIFEGTPEKMLDALTKLANLPDETLVYCAHEYTQNNLQFAASIEPDNRAIQERVIKVSKKRAKNLPTLPSTIAIEKATNPFLRTNLAAVKKAAEGHANKILATPVEVLAELRRWKESV